VSEIIPSHVLFVAHCIPQIGPAAGPSSVPITFQLKERWRAEASGESNYPVVVICFVKDYAADYSVLCAPSALH
jgi:hypothetical protein